MSNVGPACAAAVKLGIPYECVEPDRDLVSSAETLVPILLESMAVECNYFSDFFKGLFYIIIGTTRCPRKLKLWDKKQFKL